MDFGKSIISNYKRVIYYFKKKILFLKSYVTLKYLLIIDFPNFDPLTAAEMALCGNLGPKCQNLFPLVSD